MNLIRLVQMWDEYQKECYNDSTFVDEVVWFTENGERWSKSVTKNDSFAWWMKHIGRKTDFIYSHREPTFTGFMEYIRKRFGSKK